MSTENLSPQIIRQVMRELQDLTTSPPEGIKVATNEEDITEVRASIEGPVGTPYAEGLFRMKLVLGKDYPQAPPKGFFLTKIFHPNVSSTGEICVNVLKKDWKPDLGVKHVLVTVKCLLIYPNPESALNEDAGKLLLEDYAAFSSRAKMMTEIYARPPSTSSSSTSSSSCGADSTSSYTRGVSAGGKKHAGDAATSGPSNSVAEKKKKLQKKSLKRL